jgi:hypothetical protein
VPVAICISRTKRSSCCTRFDQSGRTLTSIPSVKGGRVALLCQRNSKLRLEQVG